MDKKHLKDIRLNSENKYEYMGDVFTWESTPKNIVLLCVFSAVCFLAEVAAGLVPDSGADGRPWIMIPFIIAMIMSVILVWRVGSLFFVKKKGAKAFIKNKIENWLPASSFLVGLNGAICVIASLIIGKVSWLFLVCQILAFVSGVGAKILVKKIVWKKILKKGEENN